ncbi:MAG: FAD-dependent oxidoreductase [Candidatus Taylorbacteria bacterium]|nr:FAD-dependent oxidoreductase [Candidatus Taylorbacteria bacterium]
MTHFKHLIIGGGVAGVTAAETIREKDPSATIAVVNDEPHALYSRVMLSKPNFFLGKIPFDQIWMKNEEWYKTNNITFLGGKTVTALDATNKSVTLNDGQIISYEKLLIATGVRTRPWTIPGSNKKGIYSLRTLEDGQAIMNALKGAKNAITIGGGFISFEMADLLNLAGLNTTMILREPFFWQPTLDEASGLMIEQALTKAGIKIIKNAEIVEVVGGKSFMGNEFTANDKSIAANDSKADRTNEENDSVKGVLLKDGTKLPCEMIITGIGIVPPPWDWMKAAGVAIKGGILANEYLETNVPDIYTAGDIAEYKDLILEENIQLGNWVNAREQGHIAGLNMFGEKTPFKFVSFYTTQGVGINIAFVGDVRPGADRIIIPRGSPELNSYARILVVGKELVGATLINRTSDLTKIQKLIENNVDVSEKYKELSDPNFDLKGLVTN